MTSAYWSDNSTIWASAEVVAVSASRADRVWASASSRRTRSSGASPSPLPSAGLRAREPVAARSAGTSSGRAAPPAKAE